MEAVLNHEAAQQAGGSVVQPQKSQGDWFNVCLWDCGGHCQEQERVAWDSSRHVPPLYSFERVGKHWRIR